MTIRKGSYVRIKNLREADKDIAPYIDERMYEFIGKEFEVSNVSFNQEIGKDYMSLKGNRFYWVADWIDVLPEAFKYEWLVRLDKELGV